MKEFNLTRLMESCCVEIDKDVYDALFNYIIETGISLDNLNIDDLYVNHISYIDIEELKEIGEDNCYILKKDNDGAWVIF